MSKLTQHSHLLLEPCLIRNLKDLDRNLGTIFLYAAVDTSKGTMANLSAVSEVLSGIPRCSSTQVESHMGMTFDVNNNSIEGEPGHTSTNLRNT